MPRTQVVRTEITPFTDSHDWNDDKVLHLERPDINC